MIKIITIQDFSNAEKLHYRELLNDTAIIDLSEPEHKQLKHVLDNLYMRSTVQKVYHKPQPNPQYYPDITAYEHSLRIRSASHLLLGRHLNLIEYKLFVRTLCCMGIICPQGDQHLYSYVYSIV